jgi:hypothetical protein
MGSTSMPSFKNASNITDITFNSENKLLAVSPNPVTNSLKVTYNPGENTGDSWLEIENISGRKLITRKINAGAFTETIDVSALSAGAYILRIGNHTVKFVKQ